MIEFITDDSLVQIPFNAPPSDIVTNISLYINFPLIFDYIRWDGGDSNSTVLARLRITHVSSYSGISLPANNTILPVVTLTAPDGTEGAVIDIPLKNDSRYIKHCYNALQNITHSFTSVQVNIRSPLIYTQLGHHDFIVELDDLFTTDYTLYYLPGYLSGGYTLTVNITSNGNLFALAAM